MTTPSDKRPLNVQEVGLGEGNVIPLNARERSLLKVSPSAQHWHALLKDALRKVRMCGRSLELDGTNHAPYAVSYEYGWDRKLRGRRSPGSDAWFYRLKVHFALRDGDDLHVVKTEEQRNAKNLVNCLVYLGTAHAADIPEIRRMTSMVQVEVENLERACLAKAQAQFERPRFKKFFHRLVVKRLRSDIESEIGPILERFPIQVLLDIINEKIVEDIHET